MFKIAWGSDCAPCPWPAHALLGEVLNHIPCRLIQSIYAGVGLTHSSLPPSGPRFHDTGDTQQAPARNVATLNEFRPRSHPLDIATVPDHDSKQLSEGFTNLPTLPPPLPPPQDYTGVVNMAVDSAGKPGARGPVYNPYGAEQGLGQWMVPSHSQYRAMSYSPFSTDYNGQGASGHAHGSMADWSQYPLFPYACWWRGRTLPN